MQLTAIFESWYIPDGNYPPLKRGQVVRLSFEMQLKSTTPLRDPASYTFEHLGDAEYRTRAFVLRRYVRDHSPLVILETNGFRFYAQGDELGELALGDAVSLDGTLLVDHYSWVEYWNQYEDPPDLFFTLPVSRIRKVQVPERFIKRHERGKALPTRVGPTDFDNVQEIETMEGQPLNEEFFVVDFDDSEVAEMQLPLTFIGAPAA